MKDDLTKLVTSFQRGGLPAIEFSDSLLAIKSGDLGYTTISKPIIGEILSVGYPPPIDVIEKITKEALEKINCLT